MLLLKGISKGSAARSGCLLVNEYNKQLASLFPPHSNSKSLQHRLNNQLQFNSTAYSRKIGTAYEIDTNIRIATFV
jgi:hypothetical protein